MSCFNHLNTSIINIHFSNQCPPTHTPTPKSFNRRLRKVWIAGLFDGFPYLLCCKLTLIPKWSKNVIWSLVKLTLWLIRNQHNPIVFIRPFLQTSKDRNQFKERIPLLFHIHPCKSSQNRKTN